MFWIAEVCEQMYNDCATRRNNIKCTDCIGQLPIDISFLSFSHDVIKSALNLRGDSYSEWSRFYDV